MSSEMSLTVNWEHEVDGPHSLDLAVHVESLSFF